MDCRLVFSAFFIFPSMPSSSFAAENTDLTPNVLGKVFEGYVLDSTPSRSLLTNGLFECALHCRQLEKCYYLNYQSSLEMSGRCEMFETYLYEEDINRMLLPAPGFVFVKTLLPMSKSCQEVFRLGPKKSRKYKIIDEQTKHAYDVFCDLTSEPGMAWTLVSSLELQGNKLFSFRTNYPIQEENPNWKDYRLSLRRMEALQNVSSHWRITCNFPTDGVDYWDYVRAKFSDVDFVHFDGWGLCKRVDYINIRGNNCSSCLAPWWQNGITVQLHVDSSQFNICGEMSMPGTLGSEDNFGYYYVRNAAFRCTKDQESTTNWWIGGYV